MVSSNKLILKQIAHSYGFSVIKIRSYSSQYKNIAAFRVTTNQGNYMVKPFIGSRSRLIRLSSYAARLHRKGFRSMPKWLKTRSGKHWVKKRGKLYYVTEWIEGRKIHKSGSKEDFAELGGALANLHSVSRSFRLAPRSDSSIRKLGKRHAAFCSQLKILRGKSTKAGRWFQEHGDHCMKLCRDALDSLGTERIRSRMLKESRRPPLVHGDVTIPNVLKSKERTYLIDWDGMGPGSSYFDLVVAITNTAGFNIPNMAAFLSGYEQVCPLTRSEKKLISALYRIPREAWHVCRYASSGRKYEHLLDIVEKSWNARMEAIQWMDIWSQQRAREEKHAAMD
ncbi:phosphotransferase [Paenibacillus sp. N3.4]|uniref:phosphotransferase n=1 Tax=Paenibacillus sp. N3.4 TaxID=2603222 RepID=UPI0021C320DF|nr:phosphotransferase [Paenibacillus sp. N3.4]